MCIFLFEEETFEYPTKNDHEHKIKGLPRDLKEGALSLQLLLFF